VRKIWMAGGVLAASLGLAACGTSPATLNSAVSSLSSSPDAEFHLTATASGPGTAQAQPYLNAISLDATFVNPTGANLSGATSLNSEVTVNIAGTALLDLRSLAGNLYILIDPSALQGIPSLPISANDLSAVNALFGGKWFELPKSLLDSYLNSERAKLKAEGATPPATTKEVQEERAIVAALTKFIENTPSTPLSGGGFSETASLQAFVNALWPTVEGLDPSSNAKPTNVKGSYTLTLSTAGSTVTGSSISITAPGTGGNDTVGLHATVAHNGATIAVPANATVLSESVLKGLLNEAQ
jgi:ABC-type glycerol-3-phosphate transport system substrate-binding protein